ncbi:ADP-ribosylglycohydrolase family protein [Neisseria perflava]|uniref:ADP-ribosylglycohydrolase family protein n=1 Tax=Neisseria perflava TaxID=33053 RepID=UPI0020A17766|nr:ADP-ribosylglycohydrolase family protein [Neisseria perflava]MCP1660304.1 ADP-ribosylglycohydrolase [Neisseria perflava]MCP1771533.1 ADP-ribosylglycohydrolase [Neisseria perflava]
MLGAAIGDIVGSRFEFDNYKATDFQLFTAASDFTDDTICTAAVADWVNRGCRDDLVPILQSWCHRYPHPTGAYGGRFSSWIQAEQPQPYNSWGNGSAMRVSAVGWAFDSLDDVLHYAEQSAIVTHNHPEGIKGAQATAAAIFWARQGKGKDFIREQIETRFAYALNRSCDEIRPDYRFNESCMHTVPEALTAFLDSENFEHAIRLAVSLGGDSDTLAAITGSVAEAYYREIPQEMVRQALEILPDELAEVLLAVKAK